MGKSKTKLFSSVLGVCIGSFLVIQSADVFSADPMALNAALATCREKGWKDGDLGMTKSDVSGWLLGKTANIQFTTKDRDQPKTVRLTLRKTINVLGWHPVDYSEEPHDR